MHSSWTWQYSVLSREETNHLSGFPLISVISRKHLSSNFAVNTDGHELVLSLFLLLLQKNCRKFENLAKSVYFETKKRDTQAFFSRCRWYLEFPEIFRWFFVIFCGKACLENNWSRFSLWNRSHMGGLTISSRGNRLIAPYSTPVEFVYRLQATDIYWQLFTFKRKPPCLSEARSGHLSFSVKA